MVPFVVKDGEQLLAERGGGLVNDGASDLEILAHLTGATGLSFALLPPFKTIGARGVTDLESEGGLARGTRSAGRRKRLTTSQRGQSG